MESSIRVGVLSTGFISWGGGVDFLRMVIRGLLATSNLKVVVLIPDYSSPYNVFVNFFKKILNLGIATLSVFGIKRKKFLLQILRPSPEVFNEFNSAIEIKYYRANGNGLGETVRDERIEVLLPCFEPVIPDLNLPWIGYLFDFQHKYLPHFFSEKDLNYREEKFDAMINTARFIIVNSNAVKDDIARFYPESDSQVIALPFSPIFDQSLIKGDFLKVKAKYGIPSRYFIISNQFWIHKSHITAFKALSLINKSTDSKVAIVCTGDINDYRSGSYFEDLKSEINNMNVNDDVIFVGHIPKEEQILLLRNSIAVIQPTLFEGGPGGGATYDAIAFGKPAIISDIAINKEIDNPLVTFFKVSDHIDLSKKMVALRDSEQPISKENDFEHLKQESDKRLAILNKELLDAVNLVIKEEQTRSIAMDN